MLRKDKTTDSLMIGHLNFNDWSGNDESLSIEDSCCASELLDGINEMLCGMYASESTWQDWRRTSVAQVLFSESAPHPNGCFWVDEDGSVYCEGIPVEVAAGMGFYVRGFAKALAAHKTYER